MINVFDHRGVGSLYLPPGLESYHPMTPYGELMDLDLGAFRVREFIQPPGLEIPAHRHLEPTILVVLSGEVTDTFRTHAEGVERNTMLIRPAGEPHAHRYGAQGAHCLSFSLMPTTALAFRVGSDVERVHVDAETLRAILCQKDPLRSTLVEQFLLEAIHRARGHRAKNPEWLQKIILELESPARSPSLDDLARLVGYNSGHLTRLFRAAVGCTIGGFTKRLRILNSMRSLEKCPDPIGMLALDAGFYDQSHYTRAFLSVTGTTPGKWRRHAQGECSVRTRHPNL